jgi:hypothetical protein
MECRSGGRTLSLLSLIGEDRKKKNIRRKGEPPLLLFIFLSFPLMERKGSYSGLLFLIENKEASDPHRIGETPVN